MTEINLDSRGEVSFIIESSEIVIIFIWLFIKELSYVSIVLFMAFKACLVV
jgi:hypothetical protein